MDIVINASPLILLSKIDLLPLVNKVFSSVYIPEAVLAEIQAVNETQREVDLSEFSFTTMKISNRLAVEGLLGRLHLGEVEVIVGAIEKDIAIVMLDENAARNKAKQFGLEVTGTLGFLLKANKLGLITDIVPEIIKLKNAGMYLSDDLIKRVLEI